MKSPYIVSYKEEEKSEKPNIQLILLAALIIFSGYLYMKVQALERKTVSALTAKAVPQIVTSVPDSPTPSILQQVALTTATSKATVTPQTL